MTHARPILLVLVLALSAAGQGLLLRSVSSGGTTRFYRVHVPPSYVPGVPVSVVLAFHGGGGNASGFAGACGLPAAADEHGFLCVFPEGTGQLPGFFLLTWNAGGCCGVANATGVDDVQFVSDLLDDLALEWTVDGNRVYATGLSNGGMMSYRLAVELPDRIAAVAPVACALDVTTAPTRPVPVIAFHGALDTNVPWQGGVGTGPSGHSFTSQADSIAPFLAVNQATPPATPTRVEGQATYYEAVGTRGSVGYWWLLDQGHTWPGWPSQVNPLEPFNTDIDPNDEMWAFFDANPRRDRADPLGAGCGPLAPWPALTAPVGPVLGRTWTALGAGATPATPGELWLGLPAAPTPAPGGCHWWLDLATGQPFLGFTSGPLGGFGVSAAVPADPVLHGVTVRVQAVIWSGVAELTNALELTLGW